MNDAPSRSERSYLPPWIKFFQKHRKSPKGVRSAPMAHALKVPSSPLAGDQRSQHAPGGVKLVPIPQTSTSLYNRAARRSLLFAACPGAGLD